MLGSTQRCTSVIKRHAELGFSSPSCDNRTVFSWRQTFRRHKVLSGYKTARSGDLQLLNDASIFQHEKSSSPFTETKLNWRLQRSFVDQKQELKSFVLILKLLSGTQTICRSPRSELHIDFFIYFFHFYVFLLCCCRWTVVNSALHPYTVIFL